MGRLSPDILGKCIAMARPILVEIAKKKTTITYKELMDRMGGSPGRGYVGEVVGRISEIEWKAGRPKLSAVVVRSDTGMVGGGFFGLPGTAGSIRRSTGDWQNPKLSKPEQRYWRDELAKVYDHWRRRDV